MSLIIEAGRDHPHLAPFVTLRQRDLRLPDGCFLGDGRKVVRRMLRAPGRLIRIVLTAEWLEEFRDEIAARPERNLETLVIPRAVADEIIGYRLHQGVMAMAEIPPEPSLEDLAAFPRPLLVALDGVADAENVGAIVRTCAAFGVTGLIVGPGTCSPWLRRSVRVSMGGVLRVPIRFSPDLPRDLSALGERGIDCWAAHIHGERQASWSIDLARPAGLVLGGEAAGVRPDVLHACRGTVFLPMAEGWDCLNVTAAASALLYEAARVRALRG